MRVIRYLKDSKLAVFLIIVLLIVQAFTDLSLPRYTADIVDIGIQQSGVDHVSPVELREQTFEAICLLSDDADQDTIFDSYTQTEKGTYQLNNLDAEKRDALDQLVEYPLVINHFAQQSDELSLDQLMQAYQAQLLTKDQINEGVAGIKEQLSDAGDSIVEQQAIQATIDEYKALDLDLGQMQMDFLFRMGFQMLGLAAINMIAAAVIAYIAARTAAKVGKTLRTKLFSRVVSFSETEVQNFSAASLITRGTNDIQQIQMVSVFLLRMLLYSPILAIGGIIMVSQTNASMSWIIILAVVIIAIVITILFMLAMPKFKIMQKLIDKVNLVSREILTGASVVRAFGRQDFEAKRFDVASSNVMKNQLFVNRAMAFMMPIMMLVMNATSVLIVWVGGSYIDAGAIQTGDMIAFITYSMVIIMSFLMIAMMAIMLPRADVAAQRINEVINTEPSIHDKKVNKDKELKNKEGATIAFDHVDFSYPDASAKVLTDVSFVAEAGKITAFIGSTGSGKSTLVKLIERFYDVTAGSVKVDGIDVRDLSQEKLHETLGYVPQQAFLFSGSIRSNISYADEDMSNERIELAADVAQASSFIETKEEGFNAAVSQGGTNVSGGQRQRLSIARALASQARVYLFDDSLSALDYKTDAALRQALNSKLVGKTVLIVAQRISTIMHADKIVVLDEGRIVGVGTHDNLLENCETYQEIASSQLSVEELSQGGVQ